MVTSLLHAIPLAVPDTDDQLIRAFDATRPALFHKLYGMLGNYEDAQDAVQAAFLRCWRARDAVSGLENVRAWVWRVGLNVGKDLRDLVWRRRAKPLSVVAATASTRSTSPADTLVRREQT